MRRLPIAGLLAIAALLYASGQTSAHDPTTKVTYNREIVRILDQHCVGCHRAGGSAPMALTTYKEARPWAHAMKEMVFERQMPPWPAVPGFGDFVNDPTLTPFEAELLAAWADGGAPTGDDRDLPGARADDERAADVVDEIVLSPGQSEQSLAYFPSKARADRWIIRWEFEASERIEQADIAITARDSYQRLGVWVPPDSVQSMPPGAGERLPGDGTIRVAMQLKAQRTDARAARDQAKLRLWFAPAPPRFRVQHQVLGCGQTIIDHEIDAFAIWPHAAGRDVSVIARFASGAVQPLVVLSGVDPHYQPMYRFQRPIALPSGTAIDIRTAATSCEIDLSTISASRRP